MRRTPRLVVIQTSDFPEILRPANYPA